MLNDLNGAILKAAKAATLGLATAALTTVLLAAPAHASPIHRPWPGSKLWLIKANDLAVIGNQYKPDFRYVVCGVATGVRCRKGMVYTFGSYWALERAIAKGWVHRGTTILFDQEHWGATPQREKVREASNPVYYAALIGQLCQEHGVKLIFTGVEKGISAELAVYEAAAPYAYAIGVQTQRYDGHPGAFTRYADQAAAALRALNPNVKIMLGLAPDAGGTPITAHALEREYHLTYSVADGFWLNSAVWRDGEDCAPEGCPKISDAFMVSVLRQWGVAR